MGPLAGFLVIVVIISVVWILSNIIRAQQEVAQQNARRNASRPAPTPGSKPVEKHTAGDIESFLQEIERLRRKGQDEKSAPSGTGRTQEPPRQLPTLKKQKPQQRPPETKPRTRLKLDRPAPPPIVPDVEPAQPKRLAPPPPPPPAPVFETQRSAPPLPETQGAPVVTKLTALPSLAPVAQTSTAKLLQALLRSRQGPAVAVLLQEVFGPPKCRKK
jgi:hypothetical protein